MSLANMEEIIRWNWKEMISPHWLSPAENVYFYIHEWQDKKRIIDVGAGVGRHSLLFAKNGYQVTSFDSSESGLQIINERASAESLSLHTVCGDMRRMPFQDCEFDAALAFHSIYHASQEELPKIICELYRIVKTDGEVFVTMLSKDDEYFSANKKDRISDNVVLKRDGKNGSLVPHYYIDYEEIQPLFSKFTILGCQKIMEYIHGHVLSHYYIRLRRD